MNMSIFIFSSTMVLTWILVVFASCLVPFFSRKDIEFGISIPESEYHTQFLTKLRHHYFIVSLICGIVLGTGSLLTQIWLNMNISASIQMVVMLLYLAITATIYLIFHFKVRKYKKNSNWEINRTVSATLTVDTNEKKPINQLWFLSYLAIIAGIIVVGIIRYPALPDQMPMHYNIAGQVDRYAAKSISTILAMPIMQIIMTLVFFGIHYSILNAKNQSSGGDIEEELKKNRAFKVIMSKFIFFMGLAVMFLFCITQLSMFGIISINVTITAPIVFLVVIFLVIVYLAVKVGQGGSRLGGRKSLMSGATAEDDSNWILGLFYYNRNDPSIFVEKRFGMGYTINFGNSIGKIIIIAIILLIVGSLISPFILH